MLEHGENVGYSIQAIVALRGVYTAELPTGLAVVQLSDDVQMIPLGAMVRKHFGIPFLPLTDEGHVELPLAIQNLCALLSASGDLAYIEAEIFGGAGVQAHVLVGAGGAFGPVVVAHDAINAALRSIGVRTGNERDEFESVGLGRCRETDAWIDDSED
ncbi:MAG: hypothetical protein V4724_21740 [Pseudomonadota bacterium]